MHIFSLSFTYSPSANRSGYQLYPGNTFFSVAFFVVFYDLTKHIKPTQFEQFTRVKDERSKKILRNNPKKQDFFPLNFFPPKT